jgi:hypothetical protein
VVKLTEYKRNAPPSKWQLLNSRIAHIKMLSVGVISTLLIILVVAIAQEIKCMKDHLFSESKNKCLPGRMFDWYMLLMLIPFSPIFLIIKIPLTFKLKKDYLLFRSKTFALKKEWANRVSIR